MFFHHHTIRKYTTAILDVFSDVEVPRYDETGTLIKVIKVPIFFSSRERAIQLAEQQYNTNIDKQSILPKMALSLDFMSKANNRNTNKNRRINVVKSEDDTYSFQLNSVAYDFTFTLYILSRTMSDLTCIIEQVLPLFRPTINVTMKEIDLVDVETTIVISNEGVTFDFPVDLAEDDALRVLTAEINMNMRGNLHLPIKTGVSSIDFSNVGIYTGGSESVANVNSTAYDDDTASYNTEGTPQQ